MSFISLMLVTTTEYFIRSESDEVENAPKLEKGSWFGYFMDVHFLLGLLNRFRWIYIASILQFWFYLKTWLLWIGLILPLYNNESIGFI